MHKVDKGYSAQVVVTDDEDYMERTEKDAKGNYEKAQHSGDTGEQMDPEVYFSWGG